MSCERSVRVAVLGAGGAAGAAIARELAGFAEVDALVLLDRDGERARAAAEACGGGKAQGAALDAGDRQALTLALEGCGVLVDAASPGVELHAMDACVAAGCSYVDIGAPGEVAERQLDLGPAFEERGLLALIGAGDAVAVAVRRIIRGELAGAASMPGTAPSGVLRAERVLR